MLSQMESKLTDFTHSKSGKKYLEHMIIMLNERRIQFWGKYNFNKTDWALPSTNILEWLINTNLV